MAYRIVLRQDTSANWTGNNPILLSGEFGFETDTNFLKLGDGINQWTALSYFEPGPQGIEGGGLFTITNSGQNYLIEGYNGFNPPLTLTRGQNYYFDVSGLAAHPFALRGASGATGAVPGTTNNNPVNGNFGTTTLIQYRVPDDAPASIVYQCVTHPGAMVAPIFLVDQNGATGATGATGPDTSIIPNIVKASDHTFELSDVNKLIIGASAAPLVFTVPLNSTTSFLTGSQIFIARGLGPTAIGPLGVTGAAGVDIYATGFDLGPLPYTNATLIKQDTNSWYLFGDLN